MVCNPKIIMLSLPQGILQLYIREMQNTSPNSFTVILFHFLKRYLTLITCHCNLCPDRHTLSLSFAWEMCGDSSFSSLRQRHKKKWNVEGKA